jgi:ribosomal protein S13
MLRSAVEQLARFLIETKWGGIVNGLGLIVSVVGFAVTIWNVVRTKRASQRAEDAVTTMRQMLNRSDAIMEVSAAITIMEEIKRLHRAGEWKVLLDRYTTLKRLLISIRNPTNHLSDDQMASIQNTIQHFSDIEGKVERAVASGINDQPKVPKLNEVVSMQIDALAALLTDIRQEVGKDRLWKQQQARWLTSLRSYINNRLKGR